MNLIAAADEAWGIGKDGGLLAHLPGDMKYFRETTQGKVVVMGRKTLESFPGGKPLKNRINIVLTRNGAYQPEGVRVYLDESLRAFDPVYPAAGAPNNAVELHLDELERVTGGQWVDVCKAG